MQLEQTLQMYEVKIGESDRINNHSSGLYELLSGNCGGKFSSFGNSGIGGFGSEGWLSKQSKEVQDTFIAAKYANSVIPITGKLETSQRSTKLFMEGNSIPAMRIDRYAHDGKPADHLQYGFDTYTGRSGNEAYDILGEVFRLNPSLSLNISTALNKLKK